MSNKSRHRDGGFSDASEEPPAYSTAEINMFRRIKAALKHPGVPEFMDTVTELELDQLAKHIVVRIVREGARR